MTIFIFCWLISPIKSRHCLHELFIGIVTHNESVITIATYNRPSFYQSTSMAWFNGLSFSIAIVFTTLFLLYYILKQIKLYFTRRQFKKVNGCQPAQTKYPSKDPIFGLDLVLDTIKNAKNLRHLEGTSKRYEQHGTTFTSKLITYPTVFTIDPENVKPFLQQSLMISNCHQFVLTP